jgi:secondary thiamine-phosphate synthase enzyme
MKFSIETKGNSDIIDITARVNDIVGKTGIEDGFCLVSCPGSTCGITTVEYEPGAVADLKIALEILAPQTVDYEHNKTWGDGNGFAHVRSALVKPFFAVPVEGGRVMLGEWRNLVFLDFDNRPRQREISVVVLRS